MRRWAWGSGYSDTEEVDVEMDKVEAVNPAYVADEEPPSYEDGHDEKGCQFPEKLGKRGKGKQKKESSPNEENKSTESSSVGKGKVDGSIPEEPVIEGGGDSSPAPQSVGSRRNGSSNERDRGSDCGGKIGPGSDSDGEDGHL